MIQSPKTNITQSNIIMDNQRNILLIALVVVGFLIWQQWQLDYGPKPAPQVSETVQEQTAGTPAETKGDLPEVTEAGAIPSSQPMGRPSGSQRIHVRTDVLDLIIDTRGGDVIQASLPTYPVSVDEPDNYFQLLNDNPQSYYTAQSGLIHSKIAGSDTSGRAPSHYAVFQADRTEFRLGEGEDTLVVPLTWQSEDGVRVTKRFRFNRGDFLVYVDHKVENLSQQPWVGRQYRQLRRAPVDTGGNKLIYTFTGAAYYDDDKYQKLAFDDFKDEPLSHDFSGGWVAMLQHYFLSAWVANAEENDRYYSMVIPGGSGKAQQYLVGMRSDEMQIMPGETKQFETRLFVGPKLQNRLEEISPGLELTADYGIFTVLSKPLFWLLSLIYDLIGNWGWAIIIVTILIKAAFYQLSATSYRSMAKMRAVQPKLQQLKESYGDDKQGMNKALMDLYKKEKINPLGGCLPILVQIPVFIAFYWMLLESVEMRQAPWILWIQDLSTKDPYFILPLVMGASMLIQQKLNPAPLDPMQAKIMMILPVVFTVFFAFFPSGLVLYWVTNNVLSIAQQWMIMRKMEKGAKS
jgi:YidC/Oxa1 family membrane protein insertase